MNLKEIFMLNEVLDLSGAVEYVRDYRVDKSIREKVSGIVKLRGYTFEVAGRLYAVYHFVRDSHFEIHFYDATDGTSEIINKIGHKSLIVYSTVFKILMDWVNNHGVGQSIWIGYDEDRKLIYLKLIKLAFEKYNLSKEFKTDLKFGKLPEGQDCIIIKKKEMMEACLQILTPLH